jgi:gliding motility-associated-like protein
MKLILPRHTLFSFFFILFSFASYAQDMEVTDAITAPYTPENLITNVFLGDGVEVTSFQYDGDPEAIGFFKSAEEEIGIERGILMTSGRAMANATHPGATGVGGDFAGGAAAPNITTDADLTQLDPTNANNDISRYIISFIPTSDTVRFNYVFASEEYPEYSCSSFNDVFGFFISGPGISGPFSNDAENIALIPNSTTYVSINNLHPDDSCPAVNEEYYNPNGGGNQPTYDGFTDVFTAQAIVVPCEEYTIKLVIADKGDTAFDSGVFLQAKSFGSPSLDIDIVTASLDGAVVEGCADGVITIALPSPVETDLPLDYEIFGDAVNGVDFQLIPDGLFIPAGESEINVPLIAFEDGLVEGSETFGIAFQTNFCDRDTFYLSIKDNELVDPELGSDITQCASETVTLDGTVNVPLPPVPTFTNETDYLITPVGVAVSSTIGVSGVQPLTLGAGVIRAVCMNIDHNWDDDIDVFLQSPGGQFIELTTDNGGNGNDYIETCFTEGASTQISFPGPFAPNTAAPFTGDWLPEGNWGDLYDSEYPTNGEWQLLVIDDSNGFTGSLLDWTITFEPSYDIFYEWTPSAGLSCDDCPMPDASPDVSTMYNLRAYDTYGCEVFDSIFIDVIPALEAPVVVCSGGTLECVTFSWNDIGLPSYEVNVDGTGWVPANGGDGLSHEICGLGAEQIVNIEVQGIGLDCNGFIGIGQCQTPECEVPQVVMQNATNVSCNGGSDGTLTIEMTGNFPPFTYQIDGQTEPNVVTANFIGLSAAVHDLIITDASGCELTLQVAIGEPDGMDLEDVLIQSIQCNGADDGSAAVVVTNGQYPLEFEWSSGETDSVAVSLGQGPATVTVTDAQGCDIVGSIFIDEPEGMIVALETEILVCNGSDAGGITSMVEGGEGAYTYDWVGTGQTTPDATGLTAGDYTLIVTDENMCSQSETIAIGENAPITTDVIGTEATCSGTGDGNATASGSGGGVNFFTYEWDTNAGGQTTATATGLDVGWYYVTITDLLSCSMIDSIEITAPNAMDVDFTEVTTSCFDTTDGTSSITVSGGTTPYIYVWSDGGNETPDRDDLAEGMQTMTVTDDNGCFVEIELSIPSPDEITLTIAENNAAACNGTETGSLTVLANGGTGSNYTYVWNDPNAQAGTTASNLAGGTNYCVTVFDENNCSATICDDISEPEALAVTVVIENASCFSGVDGQIMVTVTGGTEPYGYQWIDGQTTQTAIGLSQGMIQVVITDANNCMITADYTVDEPTELTASTDFTALSCDGSPDGTATITGLGGTEPYTYLWQDGQTTQTAANLDAVLYNVTVIDAQGCEATSDVTLTEPVEVVIDGIDPTNVTCFGGEDGAATIVYSGGTAPFDITWSNTETGETVTALTAGTYTVNISDQSGCNASETVVIEEPEDLNITLSQVASFCNDGTDGTASVTELSYGNTPADLTTFTYEWSNSQSTVEATNLIGGQTYEVVITDAVGCQWTESIEVGNPVAISAIVDNTRDVSCFEGSDGLAIVAGGGGNAPYTYLWPTTASDQTTATVDNLAEGSYVVTVADANGCETSIELRIEQPEKLGLNFETEHASCFGIADGEATALANGGVEPYALAWSSGVSGTTQTDLFADLYIITVVDANNCSYFDSLSVNQPEPVLTVANTSGVSCYGYSDGFIDLVSEGGTAPYTYSLDGENFYGSPRLIGLKSGSYDVTIRDGNGCEFEIFDVDITEPDEFFVDLGEDIRIEYGGQIQFIPELTGSAGGETYDWNPIGPFELPCYDCANPVLTDTFSGQATFEITVTDREGCITSDLITVFVNKEVNVVVPTGFSPNGDGQNELLHVHGDSDIEVKVFRVFDRWGEVVHESGGYMLNDMSVGWDGSFRSQKMPAGVYVWYLEIETEDGEPATFKGNTTLLR